MTDRLDPVDPPIGQLFHRLLDDGRNYVRAEVDVVRATAGAKVAAVKLSVILGVAAVFVVQAGLTVLFIALGSALALVMAPWLGQLIAAVIAFALAGLMIWVAVRRLSAPDGEKSA